MSATAAVTRASVYVDGLNLYYGCFDDHVKRPDWRQYRWLDVFALCTTLYPEFELQRIRCFTALVNESPDHPHCRKRQLTYLRALETIPILSVHRGRFATRVKMRRLADRSARRPTPRTPIELVPVIVDEEKGSDANLASCMLVVAMRDEFDVAIMISNDSDLVTPIMLLREEVGKKAALLNPREKCAVDLAGMSDDHRTIRKGVLSVSQFPATMTDANGIIIKPVNW